MVQAKVERAVFIFADLPKLPENLNFRQIMAESPQTVISGSLYVFLYRLGVTLIIIYQDTMRLA